MAPPNAGAGAVAGADCVLEPPPKSNPEGVVGSSPPMPSIARLSKSNPPDLGAVSGCVGVASFFKGPTEKLNDGAGVSTPGVADPPPKIAEGSAVAFWPKEKAGCAADCAAGCAGCGVASAAPNGASAFVLAASLPNEKAGFAAPNDVPGVDSFDSAAASVCPKSKAGFGVVLSGAEGFCPKENAGVGLSFFSASVVPTGVLSSNLGVSVGPKLNAGFLVSGAESSADLLPDFSVENKEPVLVEGWGPSPEFSLPLWSDPNRPGEALLVTFALKLKAGFGFSLVDPKSKAGLDSSVDFVASSPGMSLSAGFPKENVGVAGVSFLSESDLGKDSEGLVPNEKAGELNFGSPKEIDGFSPLLLSGTESFFSDRESAAPFFVPNANFGGSFVSVLFPNENAGASFFSPPNRNLGSVSSLEEPPELCFSDRKRGFEAGCRPPKENAGLASEAGFEADADCPKENAGFDTGSSDSSRPLLAG